MESLFNKAADLQAWNVIKKKLQRRCFPMYFVKLLRTAFIIELPLVAAFEFYYDEMVLSCDIFCQDIFIIKSSFIM